MHLADYKESLVSSAIVASTVKSTSASLQDAIDILNCGNS